MTSPAEQIENDGTLTLDQDGLDALNGTSYKEIAFWGDSLTAGRGAGAGNSYPDLVGADFGNSRTIVNEGRGGATSTEIADLLTAATSLLNDTVVIWAGRSNFDEPDVVKADIARMVSALGSNTHYLILPVFNVDTPLEFEGTAFYNEIMSLNDDLASTYSGHYLGIRSLLVGSFDRSSPTDVADNGHDVLPASLRLDQGHPNAAGNAIIAQAVHDFIASNLDGPAPQRFTISGSGIISTAASTFDLTGFDTDQNTIQSTSSLGTIFTVDNINTAAHIEGGSGFDVVINESQNLTADQQSLLFSQKVDEIEEADGTYLAPGAKPPPVITGLLDDTGLNATDGVTDQSSPTLVGIAPADSTVSVYVGTKLYGVAQADNAGDWALLVNQFADAKYNFAARESNGSGSASVRSAYFAATIDTTPPVQPTLTGLVPYTVSSASNVDGSTTFTFEGTAEGASQVQILVDGQLIGTTDGKGTATWAYYNDALALSPGDHTVQLSVEDNAGNFSSPSPTYTLSVDAASQGAPTVDAVNGAGPTNSGAFDVQGRGVILAGKGSAGETLSFYLDDALIGSTLVDSNGNYTFDDTSSPWSVGTNFVDFTQTNSMGTEIDVGSAQIGISQPLLSTFLEVASGTTVADMTVISNGTLQIDAGAYAEANRILNGGSDLIYGSGSGTTIRSGGMELVEGDGIATATSIASGGSQEVAAAGTASGTMVFDGGVLTIDANGSAQDVRATVGASLVDEGSVDFLAAKLVSLGATLTGSGELTVSGGRLILTGADENFAGQTAINTGRFSLAGDTLGGSLTLDAGTRLDGYGEVAGDVQSTGSIVVSSGTLEFARPVTGTGTVKVSGGTAEFDSTLAGNVAFSGPGTLALANSETYHGAIYRFSELAVDALDLKDILYSANETISYKPLANPEIGGTLSISDGMHSANLMLRGADYSKLSFAFNMDTSGGTIVTAHS